MRLSFESSSFLFFRKSNYDRNSLFCLSFFLIQNLSIFETETLDKHLTLEEAYRDIIKSASTTNKEVDEQLNKE